MTCVLHFLIAWFALALSHWYNPLSVYSAVDAWQLFTDRVFHAHSIHLPQCLILSSSDGLRERRKALDSGWAGFVVHPHREKSNASSDVLKSQVEAFSGEVFQHSGICVDAQFIFADLIGCYGGNFLKLSLAKGGAHVCVWFRREEVEGFFAGQRGTIKRVAVPHNKPELDKNPWCWRTSLDEGGTQPVVLVAFTNITNRIGVELRAIQGPLDNLPLK